MKRHGLSLATALAALLAGLDMLAYTGRWDSALVMAAAVGLLGGLVALARGLIAVP